MSSQNPRYTREETARRGEEFYEQRIRALVEPGNHGKIVAIDVETGAYAVAETVLAAAKRLQAEVPDAEIWLLRIGHPALRRLRPLDRSAFQLLQS